MFLYTRARSTTSFFIPPPEDTGCAVLPARPSHIAFHVGSCTFRDASGGDEESNDFDIGVNRIALQFTCGVQQNLIELWTARLSIPKFTVDAYDTSFVFASLTQQEIEQARKFESLLKAVVSLDESDEVRVYAKYLGVPVFEGPEALYWCLRHRVGLEK